MAEKDPKAAAPAPEVSMTQAELIATVTQAAVAAALKATEGKRQMTPPEVRAKVAALKNHTGEFAKKPLPADPPPGYALFADKHGRNPKLVEAHRFLKAGARVLPVESGPGERSVIVPTGTYYDSLKTGDRQLLKLNLYPKGKVMGKGSTAAVNQEDLLPSWGSPDDPTPFSAYFDEVSPGLWVNKALKASN